MQICKINTRELHFFLILNLGTYKNNIFEQKKKFTVTIHNDYKTQSDIHFGTTPSFNFICIL